MAHLFYKMPLFSDYVTIMTNANAIMTDNFKTEINNCAKEMVGDLKYTLSRVEGGENYSKIEVLARKIAVACKYSSFFFCYTLCDINCERSK